VNNVQPLVWIIVLHWRGVELTSACLNSLKTLNYQNYKTLLVDNGSDSNDGKALAEKNAKIAVLRLENNIGYSGGNNAGIKYCINHSADFIWVLNNDTSVYPDTLCKLVELALGDCNLAALSASTILRDVNGCDIGRSGYGAIDFFTAEAHLVTPKSNEALLCDWLSGANLLLRVKAIKEVGAFNDDYFLYFEDVELCARLRDQEWKCLYVPSVCIEHIGSASTLDSLEIWRNYYHSRNRLYFFAKYAKGMQKVYCLTKLFYRFFRHLIKFPFKGKDKKVQLKAECFAVRDFLLRRRGKVDYL
jgi:GT2 family glycosyltransferase